MLKDKTILITGGTGSFGNAMLDEFLNSGAKEIRIFSRDENKQDEMRHRLNNSKIKYYIGNVCDRISLDNSMRGVDFVFHAAALKQVPSCEFFPMEAYKTNVMGTDNVLDSALYFGIKKVVVLSTDKAVYPINAMGISKAMMEKLMVAKARSIGETSKTVFCATRYGNVLASRGSVIPLFLNQVKSGKDLTITDPKMTRFMMTWDDASSLVMLALKVGRNGDKFIKKAPSASIQDLALSLIDLYNSKSKIRIIGTRHGEKLFETLVNREEMAVAIDHGDFFHVPVDIRDLNYEQYFTVGAEIVSDVTEYTSHNTQRMTMKEIKEMLLRLPIVRKDIFGENDKNESQNR